MEKLVAKFKTKILERVFAEYESLWIVDAETLQMHVYAANESSAIPGSVDEAKKLNYEEARKWYIKTFIVEDDRSRMLRETDIEYASSCMAEGESYVVNYKRIFGGEVNLNQLMYAPLEFVNERVKYFLFGFRDIDRRRRAEIDEITGLFNRRAFIQRAEETLLSHPETQYDLVIADFVDFKQINETYGMKTGDAVLECFGSLLKTRFSPRNVIGRYGGDQFAELVEHNSLKDELEAGEELINKISNSGLPGVVVKCGIYLNVGHDERIITICDRAHTALNTIKHTFDRRVAYFDDELRKQTEIRRRIEQNMNEALTEKQFKVYYQPKHDAVTGALVGAEALVRWIHPEYGFMSPGEFIPIFENNGFVRKLDHFVFDRTCENIKRWQQDGIKVVPISVNASKRDFRKKGLADSAMETIKKHDIAPKYLHIEVTESLIAEDSQRLIDELNQFREYGIEVELDDFGAGYSSLNVLSDLPIDVVKLDMSFVKKLSDDKRAKVLEACISLGHNLGYKTVAEGVETLEQCEKLRTLGIDAIQGYYYSKPIPEEEFEKYMGNVG